MCFHVAQNDPVNKKKTGDVKDEEEYISEPSVIRPVEL